MKHFFTILGGLLLALAGGAEEPEFYVGACTHFAQNKGTPSQNLEMAAHAGIVSIRDEVSWQRVERQKGKLVIPDYFGKYLDEAVKRGMGCFCCASVTGRNSFLPRSIRSRASICS